MTWQTQHSETTATLKSVESHQEKKETPEERRHRRIAEAAYFIAEKRGFQGDLRLEDWLQAEIKEDSRFRTMDWAV